MEAVAKPITSALGSQFPVAEQEYAQLPGELENHLSA